MTRGTGTGAGAGVIHTIIPIIVPGTIRDIMHGMITVTIMAAVTIMTADATIPNTTGRKNSGRTGSQVSVSAADVHSAEMLWLTVPRKYRVLRHRISELPRGGITTLPILLL